MVCQKAAPIWLPCKSGQLVFDVVMQSIEAYALTGLEVNLRIESQQLLFALW